MKRAILPPLALVLALTAGCEAPPATTPTPTLPTAQAAPQPLTGLGAGTWGEFKSQRFDAKIPLPDGRAWRIDDRSDPWLVATHPPTGSELAVRVWGVTGTATRERCEEEARLRRPQLPAREGAEIVERRAIDAPAGFETRVDVGVIPPAPPRPPRILANGVPAKAAPTSNALRGFVLAFGAHGRRCFAWAFTTGAPNPGAAPIVAERLATMAQALAGVTVASGVAPQIERAPGPPR